MRGRPRPHALNITSNAAGTAIAIYNDPPHPRTVWHTRWRVDFSHEDGHTLTVYLNAGNAQRARTRARSTIRQAAYQRPFLIGHARDWTFSHTRIKRAERQTDT